MLILMLKLNACVSGTVLKISAIKQFAGYLMYLITVALITFIFNRLVSSGSSPNSVSCRTIEAILKANTE